ncbi:MAG: NfeD family protein [Eubacteriaceae bacterium]|nr:NfeD family protein [Eubacteriaceae bacterium]
MSMILVWLILFIVFLAAEVISTGTLIFIWFSIGALVALVTSYFGGSLELQTILFFSVAIVLLIGSKPIIKKYNKPKKLAAKIKRILLKRGIVTIEINNLKGQGSVSLDGKIWTARNSESEAIIPVGSEVIVTALEGRIAKVKTIEKIEKT